MATAFISHFNMRWSYKHVRGISCLFSGWVLFLAWTGAVLKHPHMYADCGLSVRPLFSIVIPVHNRVGTLRRALNSIKGQNFSSFEVICVDDHSNDRPDRIVASYDLRFRMVKPCGCSGQHCARWSGVQQAIGHFVVPMDSDDIVLPGILDALSKEIERFPDVDIFWYQSLQGNGSSAGTWGWSLPPVPLVMDVSETFRRRPLAWELWGKCIRRTLYMDAMDMLSPEERNMELNVAVDLLHSTCIFVRACAIRFMAGVVGYYYYRDTKRSCTNHPDHKNLTLHVMRLAADIYRRETGWPLLWLLRVICEREQAV